MPGASERFLALLPMDAEPILFEYYGEGGGEVYYKARRRGGGTYELHAFRRSYFYDHPCAGETLAQHREACQS